MDLAKYETLPVPGPTEGFPAFTKQQVAEMFQVGLDVVRSAMASGALPYLQLGTSPQSVRFSLANLYEWAANTTQRRRSSVSAPQSGPIALKKVKARATAKPR